MADKNWKGIALTILEWVAFICLCGLAVFAVIVGLVFFPLWLSAFFNTPWWVFLLGYWMFLYIAGGGIYGTKR